MKYLIAVLMAFMLLMPTGAVAGGSDSPTPEPVVETEERTISLCIADYQAQYWNQQRERTITDGVAGDWSGWNYVSGGTTEDSLCAPEVDDVSETRNSTVCLDDGRERTDIEYRTRTWYWESGGLFFNEWSDWELVSHYFTDGACPVVTNENPVMSESPAPVAEAGTLPETGLSANAWTVIVGIALIILGAIGIIFRRN